MESSLSRLVTGSSSIGNLDCSSSGSDNTGCYFLDSDSRSYGTGFNEQGGGVFAHEWTSSAIKIWFFSRDDIPCDITDKTPDPSTWGEPVFAFNNDACDISSHFSDHVLTIDTTLCGDWAGNVFGSSGCSGTCAETVADPSNFDGKSFFDDFFLLYWESNRLLL